MLTVLTLTAESVATAGKYGVRAFRYCSHDLGHAIAALRFSCQLLGWEMHVLDLGDDVVGRLLGLKGEPAEEVAEFCPNEEEEPEVLIAIRTARGGDAQTGAEGMDEKALRRTVARLAARIQWSGRVNRLTTDGGHVHWPEARLMSSWCANPGGTRLAPPAAAAGEGVIARDEHDADSGSGSGPGPGSGSVAAAVSEEAKGESTASRVIRERRSVQNMDGKTRETHTSPTRVLCRVPRLW